MLPFVASVQRHFGFKCHIRTRYPHPNNKTEDGKVEWKTQSGPEGCVSLDNVCSHRPFPKGVVPAQLSEM